MVAKRIPDRPGRTGRGKLLSGGPGKKKGQKNRKTIILEAFGSMTPETKAELEAKFLSKIQSARDWKAFAWLLEKINPKEYGKQQTIHTPDLDLTGKAVIAFNVIAGSTEPED